MYQSVEIPNGEISYYKLGTGEPLFLLYGFGGTFLHWEKDFLNFLAKHYTVYCCNYPGIGLSKSNNHEFSMFNVAQDLIHFMDRLSILKASILGYSMGGYIAQEMALNFSNRLKNLYLVSTSLGGNKAVPADPSVFKMLASPTKTVDENVQQTLDLNFPKSYHNKLRDTQKKWVELYTLPETKFDNEMRASERKGIEDWKKSFNEDKFNRYKDIDIPTHLFSGLKDLIVPYQNSVHLCELIPNSKLTIFEDGGHGILSQFPKDIVHMISTG